MNEIFRLKNEAWTRQDCAKLLTLCGGDRHLAGRVLYRARNADSPKAWLRAGFEPPDRYALNPAVDEADNPAAVQQWVDNLMGRGQTTRSKWQEGPRSITSIIDGMKIA